MSQQAPTATSGMMLHQSWEKDLGRYLTKAGGTPPGSRSKLEALVSTLKEAPSSPDAWLALLRHEEDMLANSTNPMEAATSRGRQGVTLFHLYEWATKTVPKRGNYSSDAYLQIWLGYARHQGFTTPDDARDTYKTLRDQHFGESQASLYREWAMFEMSRGHKQEALIRLKKGMKIGAQPAQVLVDCYREISKQADSGQADDSTVDTRHHTQTPGNATGTMSLSSSHDASTSDVSEPTATVTLTHRLSGVQQGAETPTVLVPGIDRSAYPPRPEHRDGRYHTEDIAANVTGETVGHASRPGAAVTPGNGYASSGSSTRPISSAKPIRRLGGLRGLGGPARRVMAGETPTAGDRHPQPSDPPEAEEVPSASGEDSDGSESGKKRKATFGASPAPVVTDPVKRRPEHVGTGNDHCPQVESSTGQQPAEAASQAPPEAPAQGAERLTAVVEGTEGDGDEDTVPLGHSLLAKRVLKGRPSLAPGALPRPTLQTAKETQDKVQNVAEDPPQSSRPAGGVPPVQREAAAPGASLTGVRQLAAEAEAAELPKAPAGVPSRAVPPTFTASGTSEAPKPTQDKVAAAKVAAEAAAARAPAAPAAGAGPRPREDDKTVTVKGVRYTKLEVVGRGGSSKVFKVIAPNHQIFALKRIRLHGRDSESATGFVDEIRMLHKLRKKDNIIQLIDAEVVEKEKTIFLVLEYGEIDLATMLARKEKLRSSGQEGLDENFIRLYWQQMLQAVSTIHNERIVHSDLKPANFIFVKGQLKLLDFGIAKSMQADTTSIVRENQVGTLNYMSPEAILGGNNNIRGAAPMRVGRASDIWALGCILYQMVHGATPFAPLPFIQKMHAITDTTRPINFPAVENKALQDVMSRCLDRDPNTRVDMEELLAHPFLHPSMAQEAPAAAHVQPGLTQEHLKAMLSAMVSASGGGDSVDVGSLANSVFQKLARGEQPDFGAVVAAAIQAAKPYRPASQKVVPQRRAPLQDMENANAPLWR